MPTEIKKLRVKNELGLHTRPATYLVKLLQATKSEVFFSYKKEKVSAKSILSLLMLAAPKGAWVTVEVTGEDAEETMQKLTESFENHFGEARSIV